MRSVTLIAFVLLTCAVNAQKGGSLTDDFGKLSPKERARIAKKEQEDAAKDTSYIRIMAQAEELFRKQQYDEALVSFEHARKQRPLNVYPKVKIEDLQALISKRDAARAEEAKPKEVAEPPVTLSVTLVQTPAPIDTTKAQPVKPEAVKEHVATVKETTPVKERTPVAVESVKPTGPDGVEERTYMEGRATVLERKITKNGHTEVYRKVSHPYGQVNYFLDGAAIPERKWMEAGR
ncbi:MAG TPA: hypothetical protein PK760_10405 [Flavobacteriales bacterium]|nr:hypothetical protein [Flavobacteriales bacterium]